MCISKKASNEIVSQLSLLIVGTVFVFLLWALYWLVRPYNPLQINQLPIPIINKEVEAGDKVIYYLDYCKNTHKPVTLHRKLEDGLIWALPEVYTGANGVGCYKQKIAIPIPESMPEGEYRIFIEFVYEMNPLKTVVVNARTESFKVI